MMSSAKLRAFVDQEEEEVSVDLGQDGGLHGDGRQVSWVVVDQHPFPEHVVRAQYGHDRT